MHKTWLFALALLFAGCTDAPPEALPPADDLPDDGMGSRPADGVAPQQGYQEDMQGSLALYGTLEACEAGFCVDVEASNEGLEDYHVRSRCEPPFRESMQSEAGVVHPREPMAWCQAFETMPFAAGSTLGYEGVWDGHLWDEATGERAPAPDGAYQWTVHFEAYEAADGAGLVQLAVTFTAVIGET